MTPAPAPTHSPKADEQEAARSRPDRRRRPTPMLSRFLFRGRRRAGRREGETDQVYVDHPGAKTIWAIGIVAVLSLCDAAFTLYELSLGGTEANPVMRAALTLGNTPFVLIKTFVTVAGALFLGLHKNWSLGRGCLWVALLGYLALTAWHLYGVLYYLPSLRA